MREIIVSAKDADRRLDRVLSAFLPMGVIQKNIRLKNIKINHKPAKGEARVSTGDTIQIYIDDALFEKQRRPDPFLSKIKPRLDIVYEDENLILVDKHPGLICHPDENEKVNTLISYIRAYLYQKGEYDPEIDFSPVLCNRIDRFTGGIVIAAKTEEAMNVINQKIRLREIDKRYLCVVLGRVTPQKGVIDNYLIKDESGKRMRVVKSNVKGSQRAQTTYETLRYENGLSLVECGLLTGRTHQIRVQFADKGNPLLGDNQYGDKRRNEQMRRNGQALYAYALTFMFESDAGCLNALNGMTFKVKNVPFVKDYFPNI